MFLQASTEIIIYLLLQRGGKVHVLLLVLYMDCFMIKRSISFVLLIISYTYFN